MVNQVFNSQRALTPPLLQLQAAHAGHGPADLTLGIPPGLTAVTGDEGTGKTTVLRVLAGDVPLVSGSRTAVDGLWLDLRLPGHDHQTPEQVWQNMQPQCPRWNKALQHDLQEALQLQDHLDKQLFMLSTGSRRKVGLVALLASGATITCIDQPYAALDMASVQVVRGFLQDMAEHPSRAWVVGDHEADQALPWHSAIELA